MHEFSDYLIKNFDNLEEWEINHIFNSLSYSTFFKYYKLPIKVFLAIREYYKLENLDYPILSYIKGHYFSEEELLELSKYVPLHEDFFLKELKKKYELSDKLLNKLRMLRSLIT
jgi:hypothetical protein